MSLVNSDTVNYLPIQTLVTSTTIPGESPDQDLRNLALMFLRQPCFDIKENIRVEGQSGNEYDIELFMKSNACNDLTSKMIVKILDFKKPAGTDVVNKMEKISKDCKMKCLIISNKFSVQAVSLASRIDSLQLLSRSELEILLTPK